MKFDPLSWLVLFRSFIHLKMVNFPSLLLSLIFFFGYFCWFRLFKNLKAIPRRIDEENGQKLIVFWKLQNNHLANIIIACFCRLSYSKINISYFFPNFIRFEIQLEGKRITSSIYVRIFLVFFVYYQNIFPNMISINFLEVKWPNQLDQFYISIFRHSFIHALYSIVVRYTMRKYI